MSDGILQIFRDKLGALNVSDFHGLISPGLTCYLNSVLQVLFMTEGFRDGIKRSSPEEDTLDTHLRELFDSLERIQTRTHAIAQRLGIHDVYAQQDAAEYFERVLRLTSPKASKVFRGKLKHLTTCLSCEDKREMPGFFWVLPLSIKDPNGVFDVDNGLREFFSAEKVTGTNKMYCVRCDAKEEATIKCEMTQPPDVLTLLLKRFHYDFSLKCNVKLDCEAKVPLTLQIEGCSYDLYAVVKHYGGLSGGHYTALIHSVQTKGWYCFNDEQVKLKSNPSASGRTYFRSRSAYLLMYSKRGPHDGTEDDLESEHGTKDVLTRARRDEEEGGRETFENATDTGRDRFPSSKPPSKPVHTTDLEALRSSPKTRRRSRPSPNMSPRLQPAWR